MQGGGKKIPEKLFLDLEKLSERASAILEPILALLEDLLEELLKETTLLERVRALLNKRLMENWLFPLNARPLRYYGYASIPAGGTGLVYVAFPSARPDGVLWLIADVQITAPTNTTCVLMIDDEIWQDGILNTTWRLQGVTTGGIPMPLPSFNNVWLDCSNVGVAPETPRIDVWVVEVPL